MVQPIKKLKSMLAVGVSLTNAGLGLLAIYFIQNANFDLAAILILAASLTDGLDGFCARRFHSSSEFGKEIDSLCDLISFGVAPGFFIVSMLPGMTSLLLLIVFVASGIIRLAKFNVTLFDGYFRGTPITLNGILIPLGFWFFPASLPFLMLILTITMNGPFKFKKIRLVRGKKPQRQSLSA
ncbi:MAG: CDP-alcohol phosphatidyltransferase family protein [Bacillota bacterium]